MLLQEFGEAVKQVVIVEHRTLALVGFVLLGECEYFRLVFDQLREVGFQFRSIAILVAAGIPDAAAGLAESRAG